jgi:hypothetical protein
MVSSTIIVLTELFEIYSIYLNDITSDILNSIFILLNFKNNEVLNSIFIFIKKILKILTTDYLKNYIIFILKGIILILLLY